MKLFKILTLSAVALVSVTTLNAQTYLRITGSTAFRAATMNAIKNSMTFAGAGEGYGYTGSSFTGASFAIFKGTMSSPAIGSVIVKVNWSGSVAGTRDVVQGNTISFLIDTTPVSPGGTGSVPSTFESPAVAPDMSMSDTYQASTKFPSTPALVDNIVGVVPFAFVVGKTAPAGLTNITPQLARALFKVGFVSAALFTNNNADASDQAGGTMVYACGRDPFSGTRLTALAETGVGVNTSLAQYDKVTTSGSGNSSAITHINLFPADTVNGVAVGNNGYSSGGSLSDLLRFDTTSVVDDNIDPLGSPIKISLVTYLGENDASRAVNGNGTSIGGGPLGCRYLTYNGTSAFGGRANLVLAVNTTSASTTVTTVAADTVNLVVGDTITGTGIPAGTTISSITDSSTFVISAAATATSGAGGISATCFLTTSTTISSTAVTCNSTTGMVVGQSIKGTNIPVDTTVAGITDGTHFTLSNNATATSAGTATLTNLIPLPIRNGSYTFWGYEHTFWKTTLPGTSTTGQLGMATKFKDQVKTTDYFNSGLADDPAMRVKRTTDGGTVVGKYY